MMKSKSTLTYLIILLTGVGLGIAYSSIDDFFTREYSYFRLHDNTTKCDLVDITINLPNKVIKPVQLPSEYGYEAIKVYTGLRYPINYSVEASYKNCEAFSSEEFDILNGWVFDVGVYDSKITHRPRH